MNNGGDTRGRAPSHAIVVAYLALFVALGGTATALKGQIGSDDLARNSVTRAKIAAKAVNARRLAPRSVTTSRLVPAAVVNRILGANSVTTDKIFDGGVTANDIAAAAVGGGKIAKAAVGSTEIKADAIGSGKIKDGAVSEAKIEAGAVTGSKLAAGSIPVGKLSSLVVTAGDPLVAGLGRPALQFVRAAHVDGGTPEPISSVAGVGSILGGCNAGTTVAYRNDSASSQTVFADDAEVGFSGEMVAGGANGTDIVHTVTRVHTSFFVVDPVTGAALITEVFGTNAGAPGCDFYSWSIARS